MPNLVSAKTGKKRLDVLLQERGLVESRNKAQSLIMAGQVKVLDPAIPAFRLKAGTTIPEDSKIEVMSLPRFVSRGGDKLQAALEYWEISVKDKVCLDVGASTGGFTDCMLQNGARKVYALDVGHGQIHPKIRNDARVEVFEKAHILKWKAPWVDKSSNSDYKGVQTPSFVTIDVSFISLKSVLKRVLELLSEPRQKIEVLALIKPQFEAGPKNIKKGIVKDPQVRLETVDKLIAHALSLELTVSGHFPCPVAGIKGNVEEWLYAVKNGHLWEDR